MFIYYISKNKEYLFEKILPYVKDFESLNFAFLHVVMGLHSGLPVQRGAIVPLVQVLVQVVVLYIENQLDHTDDMDMVN